MYRHFHRPSRFLWFFVGAASATWFIKSKEADRFHVMHCARHKIPQEAYPAPSAAQQDQPQKRWEWAWPAPPSSVAAASTTANGGNSTASSPAPEAAPGTAPVRALPMPQAAESWEEERQRLQKLSQQAAETLADLSEAGLDSLLAAAESLKARIAEHRAQREREAREFQEAQAAREAKFKMFEEWQKQQEEAAKKPRHIV